ncbi:MAG: ABC transporter ATP-binding protein [Desulfobacterales bacterium]|nr:MAG: ABC transporter ATP-binding protein [Desulfobacterales bacterium]
MTVVAVRNLVKSYDGAPALNDLNFETRDGEFFVLLGPSGAGKTTTLKVIAGLEDPDAGEVLFDGKRMNAVAPNLRSVGMTFESYALYPHFTVYENLANSLRAPGRKHSESDIRRRVDQIAKMLKIDHLYDRRPGELSGGQKQRVSLGRTMVGEPSVYLLDEPLSHVDAKIRFDLRIQFHRLETLQNCTSIYVTHDYVEALSLGDRIAIIDHGQIVQIGNPKQIYYTPKNVFVARLVGQPHINLLDAVIESDASTASLRVPQGDFSIPLAADTLQKLENVDAPRAITVGIRPIDIALEPDRDRATAKVRADVFEPFGSLGLLAVKAQDIYLELLLDSELEVEPDAPLGLSFREDRLIFFDRQSQQNLLWNED